MTRKRFSEKLRNCCRLANDLPRLATKKLINMALFFFAARDPDQVVSGDAEAGVDVPGDQPEAETGLSGSGERRFEEKTGQNP